MPGEEAALAAELESAETPDTPEPSGPETEGTPAPDSQEESQSVNWEERYAHLQPEYTRATQEASQLRQIIDLARQGDPEALEFLGIELEEGDTEDYDEDDDEPITRADFERFLREQQEAQQASAQEEEMLNAEADYIRQEITALEKKHGSFSDAEWDALVDLAISHRNDEGYPDVAGAFSRLDAVRENARQSYIKSKKAPKVEIGAAGTETVNLDDDDARVGILADMLEAGGDA